ncbi:phage protease [uncultured Desulfovibrio sp.]|uniref:phage protease n=1 Tax=uncultured Desulfovibrio sp. TaxID=167968 RepID=UPI0026106D46|nr:phage protease [uncultured Desulfovibrio sp.]
MTESALRRRSRRAPSPTAPTAGRGAPAPGPAPVPVVGPAVVLDERLNALRAALDSCPTEVPAALGMPARKSLDAVAERLALGVDHTVVALFGGTGSGKSSLFNALTKLQFADVGARRPTTSRAAACSWGDDANALLTFLGVDPSRRIRRESLLDADDQDELAGLVLLDVPDYDSVTTAHALQVDRLVPLTDVLVWVLDPQKYADSALHDGYLRGLGARQEDMLVLVNQIDTLPVGGRDRLLEDVGNLLVADGLAGVTVLPVSAVRGDNLDAVRRILVDRVSRESNAARTASAELDAIALRLRPTAAVGEIVVEREPLGEVVESLIQASGARAVAAREFRYISPVFLHRTDGRVLMIRSAALTNLPNLDLKALNAAQRDVDNNDAHLGAKEYDMNFREVMAQSLGLSPDASEAEVIAAAQDQRDAVARAGKALNASEGPAGLIRAAHEVAARAERADRPDPAKYVPMSMHESVSRELAALRAEQARAGAESLVRAAQSAGKLTPAMMDWGMSYAAENPAGFRTWMETAPDLRPGGGKDSGTSAAPPDKGAPSLNETEKAVCAAFGLNEDEFQKAGV